MSSHFPLLYQHVQQMHPHSLVFYSRLHKTLLITEPEGANPTRSSSHIYTCFSETHSSKDQRLKKAAPWLRWIVAGLGSISGQSIRDLWWKKWPWDGYCLSTLVSPTHYHSTIQSSIKITLTNDIIVQNHTQEGLSSHLLHFDLTSQILKSKYLLNIGVAFQKIQMQREWTYI